MFRTRPEPTPPANASLTRAWEITGGTKDQQRFVAGKIIDSPEHEKLIAQVTRNRRAGSTLVTLAPVTLGFADGRAEDAYDRRKIVDASTAPEKPGAWKSLFKLMMKIASWA